MKRFHARSSAAVLLIYWLAHSVFVLSGVTFIPTVRADSNDLSRQKNAAPPTAERIDINAAAPAELARALKGIGPAKAEAIVRYREQHGGFASVDVLLEVKGIGVKTLAKIRQFVEAGVWQAPAPGQSLAEQEAAARAAVQQIVRRSKQIYDSVTD